MWRRLFQRGHDLGLELVNRLPASDNFEDLPLDIQSRLQQLGIGQHTFSGRQRYGISYQEHPSPVRARHGLPIKAVRGLTRKN